MPREGLAVKRYLAGVAVLLFGGMGCSLPTPPKPSGEPFEHPGGFHTQDQLSACLTRPETAVRDAAWQAVVGQADAALGGEPHPSVELRVPAYYRHPEASQAAKKPLSDDAWAADGDGSTPPSCPRGKGMGRTGGAGTRF